MTTDRAAAGADPATLGYEQARDELLQVVQRLESGGVPLEQSLALWERGEALADRCQQWLDGARDRLDAARGGAADDLDDDDHGDDDEIDEDEDDGV